MLTEDAVPPLLQVIPNPPRLLYVKGDNLPELLARPRVTIVGSHKVTPYNKQVTTQIARELARKDGATIVTSSSDLF